MMPPFQILCCRAGLLLFQLSIFKKTRFFCISVSSIPPTLWVFNSAIKTTIVLDWFTKCTISGTLPCGQGSELGQQRGTGAEPGRWVLQASPFLTGSSPQFQPRQTRADCRQRPLIAPSLRGQLASRMGWAQREEVGSCCRSLSVEIPWALLGGRGSAGY